MRFGTLAAARSLHARPTFAALLVALSSLAFVTPAIGQSFPGPFPHLFWTGDDQVSGNLNDLARFQIVTAPFWAQEGAAGSRLDVLHSLNPDLKRLAYVNPAGRSLPGVEDPNHVVNRLLAAIDPSWIVRNEYGDTVFFDPTLPHMPLLNLSSRCPRVNGRTWGEFIADFAVSDILSSNRWEGIIWDNVWANASWINAAIPGSIDLDRNGAPDHPDSADVWWTLGLTTMADRFQDQVGPQVLAVANGNGRLYPYFNGRYFEDFPYRETWPGSMQQIAEWEALGLQPNVSVAMTRSTEFDFPRMRYGVTSALVAGSFSHHHYDQHTAPYPILYDEYVIDLGQPLGPPVELGIDVVTETGFETGIPPAYAGACGFGQATWTTNPQYVIDGNASLIGDPGPPDTWHLFLCTDPNLVQLTPGATYTLSFNYRIVTESPSDGYFFANARSDVNIPGSDRSAVILDLPAGTVGQARGEITLGQYPGYYLLWGMRHGGRIVIDSIRLTEGGGGVFRRDFSGGMALVNPSNGPITVDIGPGYHRINGILDPFTNNGLPASVITLPAEDGLILLADDPVDPPDPPAPPSPAPPVDPIFAYPNPIRPVDSPLVQIAGVPAGGSVVIVSPAGRTVRRLSGPDPDGLWRWDLTTTEALPVASGLYLAFVRGSDNRPLNALRLALFR
jgi:hypothetical protein